MRWARFAAAPIALLVFPALASAAPNYATFVLAGTSAVFDASGVVGDNNVSIYWGASGKLTIFDPGVRVVVGKGCSGGIGEPVTCSVTVDSLQVLMGPGNDHVTSSGGSYWVGSRYPGRRGLSVSGGRGADVIAVGESVNSLAGGAGSDTLSSGSGDDSLDGGSDDDRLSGGGGADQLHGGDGADDLHGGSDADYSGFPVLDGDTVNYDDANHSISVSLDDVADDGAPGERDNVHTDVENVRALRTAVDPPGGDVLIGDDTDNGLYTNNGPVLIDGRGGYDWITIDNASGGVVHGGDGGERIYADVTGSAQLYGDDGDDYVLSRTGQVQVSGGPGGDRIDVKDEVPILYNDLDLGLLGADAVTCGEGGDSVAADPSDEVAADCESVDLTGPPI
jgi:hypothetical protein